MVEYESKVPVVIFSIVNVVWSFFLLVMFARMHKQTKVHEIRNESTLSKLTATPDPGGKGNVPTYLRGSFSLDGSGASSLSAHHPRGVTTFDSGRQGHDDKGK